jgi:hypothetical protein
VAWRGVAWRGVVWRGVAWGDVARRGVAWRGAPRRGVAWHCVAWRGAARRGVARRGHGAAWRYIYYSVLQPKRVEKTHLETGSNPKRRTSKMVVLLVAAAGRGPAAAAAVLAWRLCQIWPRSKFGLAVTSGQEIGIGHFNRQEPRFYNNSTSKRTSLLNYMFQLIWNIHAVPTFERHVL